MRNISMRIEYIYKISRKELKRKRKNRHEKFGKLFGIFKLKKIRTISQ